MSRRVVLRILIAVAALILPFVPGTISRAHAGFVYLPGFPTLKQARPLTCESSAASMATRGVISEAQLMRAMPRSPNPNLGFRGNPDGVQGTKLVDYGVYARPLQRALNAFGYRADVLLYARDQQIMAYINRGWPVVVWITYRLQPAQPRLASWRGEQFVLVPHEHAVLVVGYDRNTLMVNDPWTATRVRYRWSEFNRSWGLFSDMALAVEPCVLPSPVTGLTVSELDPGAITWAWQPSARATQYHVRVVRQGKTTHTVFDGTTADTSYTVKSPHLGVTYLLTVTALSGCGSATSPQSLAVALPAATPTPSEGEVGTPAPLSTGTPSAPPNASITATASAAPSATTTATAP